MVIKPINISNLKTTKDFEFKCNNCGIYGTMYFENLLIDVDDKETIKCQLKGLVCPRCSHNLLDEIILF